MHAFTFVPITISMPCTGNPFFQNLFNGAIHSSPVGLISEMYFSYLRCSLQLETIKVHQWRTMQSGVVLT